ncbi:MAG: hypothetical protein D6767_04625, partial [Candidatus Hydrogenedentota bacterium]
MGNKRVLHNFILGVLVLVSFCAKTSRKDFLNGQWGNYDPSPPEIIAPKNNTDIVGISSSISLVWEARGGAVYYTVEIVKDDGSSDPFANSQNHIVEGSPFRVSGNENSLKIVVPEAFSYRWRVRASNSTENQYSEAGFNSFQDAVYVYCPASNSSCNEDTDGDGIEDTRGTKNRAFHTIKVALKKAQDLSLKVFVAKRDSSNSVPYKETIFLTSGDLLYGGYNNTTWQRSSGDYTKVESSSIAAITITGVTDQTIFEGFYVTSTATTSDNYVIFIQDSNANLLVKDNYLIASDGVTSNGIYVSSSNPMIEKNTIVAGSSSSTSIGIYNRYSSTTVRENNVYGGKGTSKSYAIYNGAASPLIEKNILHGGDSAGLSYGVYSNGSTSYPIIRENEITGGSAPTSYGVYNYSASGIISHNKIAGGLGNTYSHGIVMFESSAIIHQNLIHGGSSPTSDGINCWGSSCNILIFSNVFDGGSGGSRTSFVVSASGAEIANNIFFLNSGGFSARGIYESASTADPSSLKNNLIFIDGSVGLYLYYDEAVTALSDTTASTSAIEWSTSPSAGSVAGNITLKTGESKTNVFKYLPSEIVYTADGTDTNSTYDGNTSQIELASCANFQQNDYFEYLFDNIPRQITNDPSTSNCLIQFTPPLDYDFGKSVPIFLWDTVNTNYEKKYNLVSTSSAINAA